MKKTFPAVYVLTNERKHQFHVGVTADLQARLFAYRHTVASNHACDHGRHRLVYYELFEDSISAETRASQLERYSASMLARVIRISNPDYSDLYDSLF